MTQIPKSQRREKAVTVRLYLGICLGIHDLLGLTHDNRQLLLPFPVAPRVGAVNLIYESEQTHSRHLENEERNEK